jgi:hypothetical protein
MGFFKKRRNDSNDVKKKRRLAPAFSDTYNELLLQATPCKSLVKAIDTTA